MMNNNLKVLFLTNNKNTKALYDWLVQQCYVCVSGEQIEYEKVREMEPDMIVVYNYKYIIDNSVIKYMKGKIYNLHISYLPWNRGASPNVWSFIDDTPKGVTIHQVDAGLDRGKILFQKKHCFDVKNETFLSTYEKLNQMITELFQENWDKIKSENYTLKEQQGVGSYHSSKNLEELKSKLQFEWTDNIHGFLERYKELDKK